MFIYANSASARNLACGGAGCVATMGSCHVDSQFWSESTACGANRTSCCRTQAYQNMLAQCGYPAASVSDHVAGRAVDMIISPGACNSQSLRSLCFKTVPVCPLYHFGHCHVAMCGTRSSVAEHRQRAKANVTRIRAGQSPYSYVDPNGDTWTSDAPLSPETFKSLFLQMSPGAR